MSESTTNSTASSSDLDNVPLVQFINRGQVPPEIQNIEMVEYSEVTSGFVSECLNDEESTAGTATEEESDNEAATDEVPIDIPHSLDQKPSESWPTLQILPGGVIKPSETAEYPMNIYGQNEAGAGEDEEDQDLNMYACAKCPERFKLLFCLVKHVKWHEDQKKREEGKDLSKLTSFERELIFLKRSQTDFEKDYKKRKLDAMGRIAASMVHVDNIVDNIVQKTLLFS